MAAEHGLIVDFTTVLATSALGGYLVNRLRQRSIFLLTLLINLLKSLCLQSI